MFLCRERLKMLNDQMVPLEVGGGCYCKCFFLCVYACVRFMFALYTKSNFYIM